MFGRTFRVARILGIPLQVDTSWLVLFVVVTAAITWGQFRQLVPHLPVPVYLAFGLVTSLLFFASVVLHELAHSVLALQFGVPVKSITLFILGGVSQIAQDASRPFSELVIALAGPLSSMLLAVVFTVIWMVFGPIHPAVSSAASSLIVINIMLAVFNLVPGFPLDGGRVFRALLWWQMDDQRRATRVASLVGQGIAYLFMAGGFALLVLTGGRFLANGLWLAFIGWFLERSAERSYRQELLREALTGFSVRNLMSTDLPSVPQDLPLRSLIDDYFRAGRPGSYLVVENGDLRGTISDREVRGVAKDRWDHATVQEAMTPLAKVPQVGPDEDVMTSLERMEDAGVDALPVIERGQVVGLLGRDFLLTVPRRRERLSA